MKEGRVKILDFGIAKLTDLEPASGARVGGTLTAHGSVLSVRPPAVPPAPHITVLADLFSLGVVLYEMVAGKAVRRATSQRRHPP